MRALIAVLAALTHGCSFLFVEAPGPRPPGMYPECTSSLMWPIVDGVFAASMAASAIGVARGDRTGSDPDSPTESLLGAGLMAAAFAASAVIGYRNVGRCDDARRTFQREAVAPPGPPTWIPPPVGAEGGACAAAYTCAPGLVCASDLCVRPPTVAPAPGGAR